MIIGVTRAAGSDETDFLHVRAKIDDRRANDFQRAFLLLLFVCILLSIGVFGGALVVLAAARVFDLAAIVAVELALTIAFYVAGNAATRLDPRALLFALVATVIWRRFDRRANERAIFSFCCSFACLSPSFSSLSQKFASRRRSASATQNLQRDSTIAARPSSLAIAAVALVQLVFSLLVGALGVHDIVFVRQLCREDEEEADESASRSTSQTAKFATFKSMARRLTACCRRQKVTPTL